MGTISAPNPSSVLIPRFSLFGYIKHQSVNFCTHDSTPETLMPEGNKIWVFGDGVESNSKHGPNGRSCTPWSLRGLGPPGRQPWWSQLKFVGTVKSSFVINWWLT